VISELVEGGGGFELYVGVQFVLVVDAIAG